LRHVEQLIAAIDADDLALPELARSILRLVAAQLNDTQAKVRQIEAKLAQMASERPAQQIAGNRSRRRHHRSQCDRSHCL